MDIEKAEALVEERIRRKLCVQCAEPLSKERSELWWCSTCARRPRCVICGVHIDAGESRCYAHRLSREVVL